MVIYLINIKKMRTLFRLLIISTLLLFHIDIIIGQCDSDPGDVDCSGLRPCYNGNTISERQTMKLSEPGSYTLNVNNGELVVCGSGVFELTSNCTYNNCTIKINSASTVIINGLQNNIRIINRGHLRIIPRVGSEQLVNFNAQSNVVNVNRIDIEGDLRIDGRFVNRGIVNVSGNMWLNSNDGLCLANHSIMNVNGSSHINSAIFGDGGCLHSKGLVSSENNYVVNSNNKITPENDLVYICGESGFSAPFNYDANKSENKSGGAILQDACTGCENIWDPVIDEDSTTYEKINIKIVGGNTTICKGSSTRLSVNVDQEGDFTYIWYEVKDMNETPLTAETGQSGITLKPNESTKYRVYVKYKGKSIGFKDVIVNVLNAKINLDGESGDALLTASLADSYLWSNGSTASFIKVPFSHKSQIYVVKMEKDGVTCESQLVTDSLHLTANHNKLHVIIDGPKAICPNTSFELKAIVNGGSGDYEYEWTSSSSVGATFSDSIISTKEYAVLVKDRRLNIQGLATYRVEVPKVGVISSNSSSTKIEIMGEEMTINSEDANKVIPIGLEGGSVCLVTLEGMTSTTDNFAVEIDSSIKMICKGDSIRIGAKSSNGENYNFKWLGLNANSSEVIVSPEHTMEYLLCVSNPETQSSKIYHFEVIVKTVELSYIVTDGERRKVFLNGEGGSKYSWSYNENEYQGESLLIDYPYEPQTVTLTIDQCKEDIVLGGNNGNNEGSHFFVQLRDEYICSSSDKKYAVLSPVVKGGSGKYNYTWYRGNNTEAISHDSILRASDTVSVDYTLVVTDETGEKRVAVNKVQVMTASIYWQNNQRASLVATGGSSYLWNNTSHSTSSSIIVPTQGASAVYTVDIKSSDFSNTCTVNVNVDPLITQIVEGPLNVFIESSNKGQSICEGSSIDLTVGGLNGSGNYSYLWNISDESQNQAKKITVSPRESRYYMVKVVDKMTNAFGIDSVYVNVVNVSVESVTSSGEVKLVANGGVNYQWSNGKTSQSIIVPQKEAVYSVTIQDQYGTRCNQSIKVTDRISGSISGSSHLKIQGKNNIICKGDTVSLTAVMTPSSDSCRYQWINNSSFSLPTIIVSPKTSETYSVCVTDLRTGKEYFASYYVDVMEAHVTKKISNGKAVLSATGGDSYVWSNGASTSTIEVPVNGTDSYSVDIRKGSVSCKKQISIAESLTFDSGEIRIIGDKELCPMSSTTLTVDCEDKSILDEIEVRWFNGSTSRTIDLTPERGSNLYDVWITHKPTMQTSVKTVSVVVADSCTDNSSQNINPGKDSIQNSGKDTINAIECGMPDLSNSYYKLDNATILSCDNSVISLNSGCSYSLNNTIGSKTYVIQSLPANTVLRVESDVDVTIRLPEQMDGTIILSGIGKIFIQGLWNVIPQVSGTGMILVDKGANVIVKSDQISNEYYGFTMNGSIHLYNRGHLTIQGTMVLNDRCAVVNSGLMDIGKSLYFNSGNQARFTNLNILNLEKLGNINSAVSGMIAFETGSVANINRIGDIHGNASVKGVICGKGSLHYTGSIGGINVNTITTGELTICKSANASISSKWGAEVTEDCDYVGISVKGYKFNICDSLFVRRDSVVLKAEVSGGSGYYNYKWLSHNVSGQLSIGSSLYPITLPVKVNPLFPLKEPYVITERLEVSDANRSDIKDTVDVSYIIYNCTSSSDTVFNNKGEFKVVIQGDGFVCEGGRTRLTSSIQNSPAGIITYEWSTGETSKSILVSPSENTSYQLVVRCEHNGEIKEVMDSFSVSVGSCPPCAENIWISVDKYPDCSSNGSVSLLMPSSEESRQNMNVVWRNSNGDIIGTGNSVSGLSFGAYSVDMTIKDGCQSFKSFNLPISTSSEAAGVTLSYFTKKKDVSSCLLDNKIASINMQNIELNSADCRGDYLIFSAFIKTLCRGDYEFSSLGSIGDLLINGKCYSLSSSQVIPLEENRSYMMVYVVNISNRKSDISLRWSTPCGDRQTEPIPSCVLTPYEFDGSLLPYLKACDEITEQNLVGCTDTLCHTPVVNLPSYRQICSKGSNVKLNAYADGASYKWYSKSNELLGNQSTLTITEPGIYYVDVISWCGSSVTKSVLVQNVDTTVVFAKVTKDIVCQGEQVQLYASGGSSYSWSSSDGLSNSSIANPVFTADKPVSYSAKIHTLGGCDLTRTVTVTVVPPFEMEVEQDIDECGESIVTLEASGAKKYKWYPSDILSCDNCPSPRFTLNQDSVFFTVEGYKDGCVVKKEVLVRSLISRKDVDFSFVRTSNCELKLVANDLGQNVSYKWSSPQYVDLSSQGREVLMYFPSSGKFNISLTVKNVECDSSSEITVTKEVDVQDCDPCNPCELK